ncbi:MAG: hypothetical protein JOZ55_09325 [Alphaproteobacteria bacterium]|nr:hypothetical protein [Alphaproteobacteria bacterium]
MKAIVLSLAVLLSGERAEAQTPVPATAASPPAAATAAPATPAPPAP